MKKVEINQLKSGREKQNKLKKLLMGVTAGVTPFLVPTRAYAFSVDMSPVSAFTSAAGTLIGVAGGAGITWGIITLAQSLGENGDSANAKKGILQCIGGVLITAAGIYFASLG